MKYFIDEEFLNYSKKTLFNKPIPTIELISIGIVSEDGRKYYAISKDFNLKEAWNRCDVKRGFDGVIRIKDYWIRDNVLKPIFYELRKRFYLEPEYNGCVDMKFEYCNIKFLINKYGKTNKQIAEEIKEFVYYKSEEHKTYCCLGFDNGIKPEFYGYYSAFDYVVFSQLFGDFSQYPKGFPMYFVDLKQELDNKAFRMTWNTIDTEKQKQIDIKEWSEEIKNHPNYPKQTNEHHALSDAIWNKKLYEFLNQL